MDEKKREKTKQRHSAPETKKKVRTDPNAQEENRKAEPSEEFSAPPLRPTKKVLDEKKREKTKQRHSAPETNKKVRTDPNAQEENRKTEPSEEFQAGESSQRRRRNRRSKASEGYSSLNKSLTKALNRRRKTPPIPAPPAAAAAGVPTREADEENDVESNDAESSRRKKKGCYLSRFVMTVMCFCYLFSLVGVFAVGFWTHMEFFAYKDTETTVNKNAGVGLGTPENSTSMLRPSSSSSALNPSESTNINLQPFPTDLVPFPTDGGMGTKVSQIPAVASNNPSSNPTPIVSDVPSLTPTSSPYPTSTPSTSPSNVASESPSSEPTVTRSESPSQSPTTLDECPNSLKINAIHQ